MGQLPLEKRLALNSVYKKCTWVLQPFLGAVIEVVVFAIIMNDIITATQSTNTMARAPAILPRTGLEMKYAVRPFIQCLKKGILNVPKVLKQVDKLVVL